MKTIKCISNENNIYWLTVGKVYEVKAETNNYNTYTVTHYTVLNDNGKYYPYPIHLFEITDIGVEDEKHNLHSTSSVITSYKKKTTSNEQHKNAENVIAFINQGLM